MALGVAESVNACLFHDVALWQTCNFSSVDITILTATAGDKHQILATSKGKSSRGKKIKQKMDEELSQNLIRITNHTCYIWQVPGQF